MATHAGAQRSDSQRRNPLLNAPAHRLYRKTSTARFEVSFGWSAQPYERSPLGQLAVAADPLVQHAPEARIPEASAHGGVVDALGGAAGGVVPAVAQAEVDLKEM